ncbi:hypothetical protein KCP78_18540 [Salmonella enterica subsp. enterica]|nr:hypothetical protein KCP78_18540 [Salmonella enterica subsp. enterica]
MISVSPARGENGSGAAVKHLRRRTAAPHAREIATKARNSGHEGVNPSADNAAKQTAAGEGYAATE